MKLATLALLLAASLPVGADRVETFSLRDSAEKTHSRDEWKDRKAVVLFFVGVDCPVSNYYAPEMARLSKSYADRAVSFYIICEDADCTPAALAKHAAEYALPMTALLDPRHEVASQAGAKRVPTAVVLSAEGEVLYRGRIDDRYATDGKRREEPSTHDLRDAIDAILAGKPPAAAETPVFGCPIPSTEDKGK